MAFTLHDLEAELDERKQADPKNSYVAQLHQQGLNKILEKIGEESTEVILAAKDMAINPDNSNKKALIGEVADLWFHSLVMLSHLDLGHCDIINELERRFGRSGLDEKASRNDQS